jgi:hypothetical protein
MGTQRRKRTRRAARQVVTLVWAGRRREGRRSRDRRWILSLGRRRLPRRASNGGEAGGKLEAVIRSGRGKKREVCGAWGRARTRV